MEPRVLSPVQLSPALESNLRRTNPWWEGRLGRVLPQTRRHLVGQMRRRLDRNLAPIVAVRGPRQIGKTTSQEQLLADLLAEGLPPAQVLRVQVDEIGSLRELGKEPILRFVDWYEAEILGRSLNEAAHAGAKTYLFFDEVQNLPGWAPQLKFLVDHSTTQVVVTGSSALRIEQGRDSLAGRLTTINAGVLSLTEIGMLRGLPLGEPFLAENGLEPLLHQEFWTDLRAHGRALGSLRDRAFAAFSERGGYPLMHVRPDASWAEMADQLNENVIRRVIEHDLRIGARGRKRDPALLEELFRLCCRYAGQSPRIAALTEALQKSMGANVGVERVRQYLRFLSETLLVRLIEPLEIRLQRARSSSKVCLADHALRASWLQEQVPLTPEGLEGHEDLSTLAGHLSESAVGAVLSTIYALDLAWFPPRGQEPEVDFVLSIGMQRIPIEVKYQRRPDPVRDTAGLRSFLAKPANRATFGLLITRQDDDLDYGERIVALPLSSFLLLR